MSNIFRKHRNFWTPERKRSMWLGVLIILLAIAVQLTLGPYSSRHAGTANPAGDLFLEILPVVNLSFVIVLWAVATWFLAWWLLAVDPRRLIFGTKAIAFFIICRAIFISLTHIGLYPTSVVVGPSNIGYSIYKLFDFQGNYFFSGHTGFPFLLALIFWDVKLWRRFFLFLTVFFGAAVLFAHVHYSIDVFAAPFIVYGTFVITAHIFKKDYALIPGEHPGLPEQA